MLSMKSSQSLTNRSGTVCGEQGHGPDKEEWLSESELSKAHAAVNAYERSVMAGGRRPKHGRRHQLKSTESDGGRSKRDRLVSEPTKSSTNAGDVG